MMATGGEDAGDVILMLDPAPGNGTTGYAYPFGIDPMWALAENKLNFLNSFKMKMSVILGIGQMTFGVILSLYNYRFFHKPLDVTCMFIPQIIFLACLFIYLVILIIYKWLVFGAVPFETSVGYYPGSNCAPSLLIGFINMFMFNTRQVGFINSTTKEELASCNLTAFYPGQNFWEKLLVIIAVVCVPWMLVVKPYILWKRNKQSTANVNIIEKVLVIVAAVCIPWMLCVKPFILYQQHKNDIASVRADVNDDNAEVQQQPPAGGGDGHGGDGPFSLGDTIVYQAIHTIEFSLGCISHTASYLRLWALSLAHAQLSEVLWDMVLRNAFSSERPGAMGAILIYAIFFGFMVLTVTILVMMEGLSAFLHALRLHWVEFQSKFYGGTGYAFVPFSFDAILEQARAGDAA